MQTLKAENKMNNSFRELLEKRLADGDVELPVFDSVALKIHKQVKDGTISSEELSILIERDPVLVADILRTSNSSFFAGMDQITNLQQALVRMGMKQISSLVMSSAQKRLYSGSKSGFRAELIRLWGHASAVGSASRWIAINTDNRAVAEDAFVAGMLHDIGKLNLIMAIEDVMKTESVKFDSNDLYTLLDELHVNQGVLLLNEWNMAKLYKDVIQHVDEPNYANNDMVVRVVRLADRLCSTEGIGYGSEVTVTPEQWSILSVPGWNDEKLLELKGILEDL